MNVVMLIGSVVGNEWIDTLMFIYPYMGAKVCVYIYIYMYMYTFTFTYKIHTLRFMGVDSLKDCLSTKNQADRFRPDQR